KKLVYRLQPKCWLQIYITMFMIIVLQEHSQGASTSNRPSVPGSQMAGHLPGSYDKRRFLNPMC
ncbi:hypothetical protein J4U66_25125, partial [Escherichia coli]